MTGIADAQDNGLPEAKGNVTGYTSVAVALSDLEKRPGVVVSNRQGWVIIEDKQRGSVWSFSAQADPSYPSAVRRTISTEGGAVYVHSDILCEASKTACDDLVRRFGQLDQQMRAALGGGN
jgi:hypothetical protein